MDWASVILGAFIGVAGVFGLTSLALYPLMRRSFLLWNFGRTIGYGLIAVSALSYAQGSGKVTWSYADLGDVGVALSIACAGPFLASYLEPGRGFRPLRNRLRFTGWLGIIAAATTPFAARYPVLLVLYDGLLVFAIVVVGVSLAHAIRGGSRAARYQAWAWGPVIAVGLAELSYELVTGLEYWLWPLAVLLAVMADFIVTSLGLVDGFLVIKRERDVAIANVREANRASALDPLTGIANRRGLAQRFASDTAGRPQGIALIDCDHFKRINDNLGHDVGDEALIAVARALQGPDLYVGRLGGEEFIALIYHRDWQAAAEAARRRIEAAVRKDVPQIAFRVTASAGLAEVTAQDTLETAMKRADQALYAAKDAGRDRSLFPGDAADSDARLLQAR